MIAQSVSTSITNKIVAGNIQKAVQATLAKIGKTNEKEKEVPKTTAIKEVKQLSEKKSETKMKNESE